MAAGGSQPSMSCASRRICTSSVARAPCAAMTASRRATLVGGSAASAITAHASAVPRRKLLVGAGTLLLLLPGYLYQFFSYQIEEKLIGSSSFAIRYDRYDFFTNRDLFDVLTGYGNHYYMNDIVLENLAGWDSFLQLAQVYGLWFPLFLIVALCWVNRKHWVAAIIIVATFFAQSIWMMPIIACFYFAHSVNLGNANFSGAAR